MAIEKQDALKLLDSLDEALSLMSQAPGGDYQWWSSADGVDPIVYLAQIAEKTAAFPVKVDNVHSVGLVINGEELNIAVTGFGPKSRANARAICFLLRAAPWLLSVARHSVEHD